MAKTARLTETELAEMLNIPGWDDQMDRAYDAIADTYGYAYFHFNTLREFLDSGPYTPRQAVLSHLHWIAEFPNVYEGTSARRMYDNRLR